MVVVMIVLACLPNSVRSPLGSVTEWYRRRTREAGSKPAFWARVVAAAIGVVLVLRSVVLVVGVPPASWAALPGLVQAHWMIADALLAVVAVFGATVAYRAGYWLRRWHRPTGSGSKWSIQSVSHPAGVSAGWSWVYGVLYVGLVALSVWLDQEVVRAAYEEERTAVEPVAPVVPTSTAAAEGGVTATDWHFALLGLAVGSAVLGLLLLLVVPVVIPGIARRSLSRVLAADPALLVRLRREPLGTRAQTFVDALVQRGSTYRYLVEKADDGNRLRPSAAGWDLIAALQRDGRQPWSSVPVTVHVIGAAVAGVAATTTGWSILPTVLPAGAACLFVAGVLITVGLAVVEGVLLGRRARDAVEPTGHPGAVLAASGAIGLLLVVEAAASAVPSGWAPEIRSLLVLATVMAVAAVSLPVVLYTRRRAAHTGGAGSTPDGAG
jgi:hypothetical protein